MAHHREKTFFEVTAPDNAAILKQIQPGI